MADYVTALDDLYVGVALAHRKGDPEVPKANVEPNGWTDLVAGPDTKAAVKAQKAAVSE